MLSVAQVRATVTQRGVIDMHICSIQGTIVAF
jgi:hypothetical protein